MADTARLILDISSGVHDDELDLIADALTHRQSELTGLLVATTALAAYAELTGIGPGEILETLANDEE